MLKCRLKEIRLREFMQDNKREFAKTLNVKYQTYVKWENEESYPNLELAYSVARRLDKAVTDIWYLD